MLAFSRITSVLFFVLSLSFFVYAAPTPAYNSNEVAPDYSNGDKCLNLVKDLHVKVNAHAERMVAAKTVSNLDVRVSGLVVDIKACAEAVVALGSNIAIQPEVKAELAAEAAAIVKVIVNACVSIVAKFGILVVLTILAKIDICLQLLLVNLGVCVHGLIELIAKIVVQLGVSVFASVHLGLCIHILGLIGLSL